MANLVMDRGLLGSWTFYYVVYNGYAEVFTDLLEAKRRASALDGGSALNRALVRENGLQGRVVFGAEGRTL